MDVPDDPVAIRFTDVAKRYVLGQARYGTFREALLHAISRRRAPSQEHWAVRDLSFEIRRGECVGLIGSNGAGKTSVLKLIGRISRATQGTVETAGRIASLIEVGAGFHQELTGRENVELYGGILGMTREEITRRYDEIVDFAGLERFMDVPVKRYSSGMHVRLGFSVAVHADPDILLMDEVLAVGDITFQQKCLDRVRELRSSERVMMLVSHNLRAVESMCERAIWIDRGELVEDGSAAEVIAHYMKRQTSTAGRAARSAGAPEEQLQILGVELLDASGEVCEQFRSGDPMTVRVHYRCAQPLRRPHFAVTIYPRGGEQLVSANMVVDGRTQEQIEGEGILECRFRALPLYPRSYSVCLGVTDETGVGVTVEMQSYAEFTVHEIPPEVLPTDGPAAHSAVHEGGPVLIPYEWSWLEP